MPFGQRNPWHSLPSTVHDSGATKALTAASFSFFPFTLQSIRATTTLVLLLSVVLRVCPDVK